RGLARAGRVARVRRHPHGRARRVRRRPWRRPRGDGGPLRRRVPRDRAPGARRAVLGGAVASGGVRVAGSRRRGGTACGRRGRRCDAPGRLGGRPARGRRPGRRGPRRGPRSVADDDPAGARCSRCLPLTPPGWLTRGSGPTRRDTVRQVGVDGGGSMKGSMRYVTARRHRVMATAVVALTAAAFLPLGGAAKATATFAFKRFAGADRYDTARLLAQSTFGGGASDAVIARGDLFPDALAGSYLAGAKSGPILLTAPGSIPQPALDAL